MRLNELLANLTFWLGSPALAWWLVSHRHWSWFAAAATAIAAGVAAALAVSALVGAATHHSGSK